VAGKQAGRRANCVVRICQVVYYFSTLGFLLSPSLIGVFLIGIDLSELETICFLSLDFVCPDFRFFEPMVSASRAVFLGTLPLF